MDDRRVHVVVAGAGEVVRYDRAGKWYHEVDGRRVRISLDRAVRLAMFADSTVHLGVPGGGRFDAALARRNHSPEDHHA